MSVLPVTVCAMALLYTDERVAEVSRLTTLGASVLAEGNAPGLWWTVLADPEGNEFCVGSYHG